MLGVRGRRRYAWDACTRRSPHHFLACLGEEGQGQAGGAAAGPGAEQGGEDRGGLRVIQRLGQQRAHSRKAGVDQEQQVERLCGA